jgi:hypothetical protein
MQGREAVRASSAGAGSVSNQPNQVWACLAMLTIEVPYPAGVEPQPLRKRADGQQRLG